MIVKHERDAPRANLSSESDLFGVELIHLVTEKDGAKHFSMRLFRLSSGGYTPFHSHPWEHEVFVIRGEGELMGDESTRDLTAGTAAYVPEGVRHRFKAGRDGMVFICCIPHVSQPER